MIQIASGIALSLLINQLLPFLDGLSVLGLFGVEGLQAFPADGDGAGLGGSIHGVVKEGRK